MASLAGKTYAVTGGASGMGLATCERLATFKAKAIAIGDFNTQAFDAVREKLLAINPDLQVLTIQLDVSSRPSVDAWFIKIIEEFGALDGLVNSAGVPQKVGARKAPNLLEETDEMWERTMGVNLNGVFFCTRAAVKAMINLPKTPRSIVNISSMAALLHTGDCYAYGTSKRAVSGLTTAMSKDVAAFGIRVNAILPSVTRTPMLAQFFDAPKPSEDGEEQKSIIGFDLIEPSDIAEVVTWLLSDESKKVSGVNIPVGASAM